MRNEEIDRPAKKRKTSKKKKLRSKKGKNTNNKEVNVENLKNRENREHIQGESSDFNSEIWTSLGVPSIILKALKEQNFETPTEIQTLTLPPAILGRRDILGAAETGSGKTLAFGIPIINGICELKKRGSKFILSKSGKFHETENSPNFNIEDLENLENENAENLSNDDSGDEILENFENEITENSDNLEEYENDSNLEESDNDSDNLEESDDDSDNLEESDNDSHNLEESDNDSDNLEDSDEKEMKCVRVIDNIKMKSNENTSSKPLYALILTPTRELAIQIKNHLTKAAKYTDIKIAVVLGGMAAVKQERILKKGPEIVIATPGRLWELVSEGNPHLNQLDSIK